MVDSKPFFVTWRKARLPPPSRASNSESEIHLASASQPCISEIGAAPQRIRQRHQEATELQLTTEAIHTAIS
jgi:hypothetical protein